MNRVTLTTKPSAGYELVDSGEEEKLERFGDITLARPDPQALWEKRLANWAPKGRYVRKGEKGEWVGELPLEWEIEFEGFKFLIKPTSFKHTGLFPEQASNWSWIRDVIKPGSQVLNLFAYTGGATLAAAAAGAEVTHVDASKIAVSWAHENAKLSGLEDKPIRWIVEDVLVYIKREIKRGKKYDLIVMDPPAFGHGPNDELWKFEENFLELMQACHKLLSEKPLGILINGYAAGYASLAFAYNLDSFQKKYGGEIEYGDLTIEEKGSERLLPCGIFARWRA
ncbi:class I SAM-dependent methyltransferase [Candidatus Parcubacteria bacterium]|nr:class I SAM-dependent methyltransferase [Candidatus Parcubacteria bacterium]